MSAVAAALVGAAPLPAATAISITGTSSPGYAPASVTRLVGTTFTWTNDDPSIYHTATQDAPLGLWDSGHLAPGASYSFTVKFAGTYRYHCHPHPWMTGVVKLRPKASPLSGRVGTTFYVRIATVAAPSGMVYDVQKKVGSGAWTAHKTGMTAAVFAFKPSRAGTYSFRSRVRKTADGATSGWSPARTITATSA